MSREQFKRKAVITAAVEALIKHARTLDRGATISWNEVEKITGFKHDGEHWSGFRSRFAKRLRIERGIALLLNAHGGFHLCTIEEQMVVNPTRRRRKSIRNSGRIVAEQKALPDSELSDFERRMKHQNIDWARLDAKRTRKSMRLLAQQVQPTETLPRPKPAEASA